MADPDGVIEDTFRSVNHLGIVAGTIDSLKIWNLIDEILPKNRHHHISHSQVTQAMLLNGLGYVERPLYLYPEFFEEVALERLLGEGVQRGHLTDDTLGRTLDVIAAYGSTEIIQSDSQPMHSQIWRRDPTNSRRYHKFQRIRGL